MVWRGRVSIHDDLSRIHRSMRGGSVSRDTGYSSISMGEGALELRVTDDESTRRVVLGDQDDGRFGIGLWHRGRMQYLPDVLTDAEDRITATEVKNRQQDDRLDTHESRLDGHDDTLASHNTRINTAQSRADSAYSRAGDALGAAATAQSRADSAYSRAGTALGDAADAMARANSAYSRAGEGVGDAAGALARANSAYSLAAGKASASALNDLADRLTVQVARLDRRIDEIGPA